MQIDDNMIKSICSDIIYRRGTEYFALGRVHLRKREPAQLTAVIDGGSLYTVQVSFDGDKISDCFCTCQYYSTMRCACKHVVATLKQYQAELEAGEAYVDDNDRLAAELCSRFTEDNTERTQLNISFALHIFLKKELRYGISLSIGGEQMMGVSDIGSFLEAYASGGEFVISKHETYSRRTHFFAETASQILDILVESHQNKAVGSSELTQAGFGVYTARRLMTLLEKTGFSLYIDSGKYADFQIKHENPDILVDISAMDTEINLSVADAGLALIPDGSWFFYENDIYCTDRQWRDWYMPIYSALTQDSRTQLQFKGNNTVAFAAEVLPKVRGQHGVSVQGISNLVVEAKPRFEIYFDKYGVGISAVIRVFYGSIAIMLPDEYVKTDKVIVRDYETEGAVLECFSEFLNAEGLYTLTDDIKIFDFLSVGLPCLQKMAKLYYSDAFKTIHITSSADIYAHVSYKHDINLLEMGFETSLSSEEIRGILSAVRLRQKFYRLTDGRFLALDRDSETLSVLELIDRLAFNSEDLENGSKILNRSNALYLESAAQSGIVRTDEGFEKLISDIREIQPDIPAHIKKVLRPYQTEGVTWFCQLSAFGMGGILADDMGLGKTLQVIAFMCAQKPSTSTLIVTPSALTYNWDNEIKRFAPEKTVMIVDGSRNERAEKLEHIAEYDFVITSYPLLRRDSAFYDKFIFDYFFIDEAQYIKNPSTMNARTVKRIHANHRFALTGTPIENSLTEIWSIFDFVMSGYLYSYKDFCGRYEAHIGHSTEREAISELRGKIAPFVIRRMKNEVLTELPEKIENTMLAELTKEQKELYISYLAMAKSEAYSIMSGENTAGGRMKILALLIRLRQICCHPRLFNTSYKKDSGKLELLEELVSNGVSSGHSILIFSQFTSMLAIIKERLEKLGVPIFYLDGSTPSEKRTQLAERFNNGEAPVFLISLKAGGTGLNLTGADMVIHYDPWWNPAVMDQASDRAHRIGQRHAVQVIKLASRGTIEEKIIHLQDKKRMLADGVIQANKAIISKLSNDEILALFD
jgi:superfamily II DNA or RNA helicase